MATEFDLQCELLLEPIWHRQPPRILVSLAGQHHALDLDQPSSIAFQYKGAGHQRLMIDFQNKTDLDSQPDQGLDMAVIIRQISFFGISDDRFVWQGRYSPRYPEPWASEQRALGRSLSEQLSNVDRMSWNGIWTLDFELPIFTWIHQVQNLGWIYR